MSGRGKYMLESEWLTSAMESYAAHSPERILVCGSFLSTIENKLPMKIYPTVHRAISLCDDGTLNIRMEPKKNLLLNVRGISCVKVVLFKAVKVGLGPHFYHLKIKFAELKVSLFLETEEIGKWLAAFGTDFSGKESTKSATPKTPVVHLEQLPRTPVTPPVPKPKSILKTPDSPRTPKMISTPVTPKDKNKPKEQESFSRKSTKLDRLQQDLETWKQDLELSRSIRSRKITVSVIRKLLETKSNTEDLKATVQAEPVEKPDTRPIKIESGPPKQEKMSFGTEPGRCQSAPAAFNYDDILYGKKAEPQLISPEKETENVDGVMQEKEEQKQ